MSKKSLYCNYAWGHLDFHQKGCYTPCFRFNPNAQPMKKISECLPTEAMNSPEMVKVRETLLNGQWPEGCFECKNKEEKGLRSYRQESIMPDNITWNTFNPDYSNLNINKYHEIEIKFSRTCNFFCRHCDSKSNSRFEILGKNNSKIKYELESLDFQHLNVPSKFITEVSDEVIEDLILNIIPNVSRIMFSGGEPLYHVQHYRFLERLINDDRIDTSALILEYNTNFSMINFKNYSLSKLWNQFGSVRVTVSIDGTGNLFNYFRQNGNFEEILKNIHAVLTETKTISNLSLVCTSSTYHAFYMDQTINDIANLLTNIYNNYNVSTNFKLTFVHYPDALDMVNLDNNVKDFLINRVSNSFNPEIYHPTIKESYEHAYKQFLTYLKNEKNLDVDFKKIAKLQDQLHNSNAFELVPRIAEYVYNDRLI